VDCHRIENDFCHKLKKEEFFVLNMGARCRMNTLHTHFDFEQQNEKQNS